MIKNYNQFLNEAAPRIPNSPDYWVKKLEKRGKDVMIYTHDDLDGIFSGIAIKKYFLDHGFKVIGYGLVNYQDGWSVINIDKGMINVAVDFAEVHPDIDVYIDHHGSFVDGDEVTDAARKTGAIKTKTGSAYEGIMDQLGLPVDQLVLSVIDMVDSAKYDEYGVKWTDLLDFEPSEIKKKPNAKLLFAGAFNQLLKRGDYATIIEVIHNVDEPSIFKIFDYMKRLYPGNNKWIPRGWKEEDISPSEYDELDGKDFVDDGTWRLGQMKGRTRGKAEFKGVMHSQAEFIHNFMETIEYDDESKSKFAGKSAQVIKMDGYCIIGELVFVGSGTWANAIRARAIIQQDIEKGRIKNLDVDIKWVLLQYGDTLQVCGYGKVEKYDVDKLPKNKDGSPINDLKKFCINTLNNFKTKINFNNPATLAGGHTGIGTISNIGGSSFMIPPDEKEYNFLGLKYLDIFKNYMIASLSQVPWSLKMSWENPFSPESIENPTPMDARVMTVNQIRRVNKQTGEVEKPLFYKRKPSIKMMQQNEIKLKELEKEAEQIRLKDATARSQAEHEYYKNRKEGDVSYADWSEQQKNKGKENKEEVEEVTEKKKLK